MKTNAAPRALASTDEIRALLQAAQFAASRLEELHPRRDLLALREAINSARAAADSLRLRLRSKLIRSAQSRPTIPVNRSAEVSDVTQSVYLSTAKE